jgi:hypothetical protein
MACRQGCLQTWSACRLDANHRCVGGVLGTPGQDASQHAAAADWHKHDIRPAAQLFDDFAGNSALPGNWFVRRRRPAP